MAGLRKKSLSYSDEASQYGFEDYKTYKKENRGGLKAAGKGASSGASAGATVGGIVGSIVPGVGNAVGAGVGAGVGAIIGGTAGAIVGNRKMKKEYLDYAKSMTDIGQEQERLRAEAEKQPVFDYNKFLESYQKTINPQPLPQEKVMGIENNNIYQQQYDMYKFKSGGLNQYRTINIEKGELLVNPKTLEILDHYNDAPKHPEGKHEIDLRGNREVPVGMAIIPAKFAEEFKSASPERKKEIINSLPGFNGNPKAREGINDSEPSIYTGPTNYDWNSGLNASVGSQYSTVPVSQDLGSNAYMSTPDYGQRTSGGGMGGYAPLVVAGAQLGYGLYQTIAANKALKKLGKEPYAMYNEQVQPELQASYGAAQGRAADAALRSRYGLSQAQQAMYNQNVARDINTRMQRAQDIGGGNIGATVGTIMNANKIQAAQQQAALDAQLQMQKQQYADRAAQYAEGLAQRIAAARQGQQNQNTAFQQQLRLQKERAYGLAKQQGMQNIFNAPASYAAMQSSGSGGMNASQLMQLAQLGLI